MEFYTPVSTSIISTPFGRAFLEAEADGLTSFRFLESSNELHPENRIADPQSAAHLSHAIWELQEYFAGRLQTFQTKLSPKGTEFEKTMWSVLKTIPFGSVITYGQQACQGGQPAAIRAAGRANARNPLLIFVPCHRVIRSNGQLGGYSGGSHLKRALLELENQASPLKQEGLFSFS